MGRPLSKSTLSLLRPTANIVVGGSELPATIVRQESSTGFTVTTADGTGVCTLTTENPQPGQMRLKAFAADESSYYITHISKELVTVKQGTGTSIPSGNEVRWNLNTGTSQDLVLANISYWKWLSILDTVTITGFTINGDKSIFVYGYATSDDLNIIMKISPMGEIIWSTKILGVNTPYKGFGGIADKNGNVYVTNASGSSNKTYIVKISSNGEIAWQKEFEIAIGFNIYTLVSLIDSKNNFHFLIETNSGHIQVVKLDTAGNILWQNVTDSIAPLRENVYGIGLMPDDTFITGVAQSVSPVYNNVVALLIRYNIDGSILSKFGIKDSQDPVNKGFFPFKVAENNSAILAWGTYGIIDPGVSYGSIISISFKGEMLWQVSYGKNGDGSAFYDLVTDEDDNLYAVLYDEVDFSTVVTKWNASGNLIWQKHITNADDTLYFFGALNTTQYANNHIYIAFYNDAGDQAVLRFGKDGPISGSYTEPFQYTVTDAAADGYGLLSSNLIMTTANVTVNSTNYTTANSNLTQINQEVDYEFGYQS